MSENPYLATAQIVLGAGALGLLCACVRRLARWGECWLWWWRLRRQERHERSNGQ